MSTALVTGGAGFIGSNLALELERQGYTVIIADNFLTGKTENLEGFKGTLIGCDIAESIPTDEKLDVIFHEAAITDPRHPDDKETYDKNIQGFRNVIDLATENNCPLIYASTAGLYGNGPVPMREDQDKEILSVYGKSKLEMDRMAEKLSDSMRITGLRYFNVFGPREAGKGRPASMIYHLSRQMKAGKPPRVFKHGEQKRDHVYVKDVVDATIQAWKAGKSGIFNVGTGTATSFNDLIKILNEVLGTSFEPEYFDMPYDPKTYQSDTQADTTLSEKKIGWKAKWSLKEGIQDYMRWLDEQE